MASSYSSALKKPRALNPLIQAVGHHGFEEVACGIAAKKNPTQPESNKEHKGQKKKKKGKKGQPKREQNGKDKPGEGNDHIVAALVQAINEDYWPDIIYYSTLHPEHLQGWHPDESEWVAGHRMSMALSDLPEEQLKSICDHRGVLSVEKLAKVWAKKRLDQVDYIPGIDYDEDLLAADIPWPAGPNKPKEPWAFELDGHTLTMEKRKSEPDGSDRPDSGSS